MKTMKSTMKVKILYIPTTVIQKKRERGVIYFTESLLPQYWFLETSTIRKKFSRNKQKHEQEIHQKQQYKSFLKVYAKPDRH